MTTEPTRRRVGRPALALTALGLAGSTALITWWTTTIRGLPDVGDPFDVEAFALPIPDATNAFVLYRKAVGLLPEEPPDLTGDWKTAGQAERAWLERSREALGAWREGTGRPDARYNDPALTTFETRLDVAQSLRSFCRLALLEGSRLEGAGDPSGALDWYLAALRSSRHCGRRGVFIERLIGVAMYNVSATRLTRWAAEPGGDAGLLRKALGAATEAGASAPPLSDGLKAEYLSLVRSIADPELMARMYDSEVVPNEQGGSTTVYGRHGWRTNFVRVGRRAINEPERSRRVVRMIFANWLTYCDRPASRRPPKVLPGPTLAGAAPPTGLLADLYAVDALAPAQARALPPEKLADWFKSTMDASLSLPAWDAVERAIARERSMQGNLVVSLANELHKREQGRYPDRIEDLVGPYLQALPDGYRPIK